MFGKIKKALSRANSKEAKAERARVEAVEQLLLNALAEKGYTYRDGKVISMREPEEKDGEAVDNQGEVRYNKNGGSYSQYRTTAMQWANSPSTEKGDTKVLYDPQTNTWNRIVADDSDGGYSVLRSVKDTPRNQSRINDLLEGRYDGNQSKRGTRESVYRHYDTLPSTERNNGNDYSNASERESGNGQTGELYKESSESNRGRDIQGSGENQQNIRFSRAPQTETEAFKRWFGDSKVVNEDGTPKVVYHGTDTEFYTFDLTKAGNNFGDTATGLFFFTDKAKAYPNSADDYARYTAKKNGGEPRVMSVYLTIQKPLAFNAIGAYDPVAYFDSHAENIYDKYFKGDYDGIIVSDGNSTLYAVDNATKIKSADPVTYGDAGNVIPLFRTVQRAE